MSLPTIIKKTREIPVLGEDGKPMKIFSAKDNKYHTKTKQEVKVYVNPAKHFVRPHWQTTDTETINLGALAVSGSQAMIVDESLGHFEIFYLVSDQTGPFTMTVKDEGRNQTWSNRAVHIDTIAGVAQRPFILPETYFLNTSGGTRQLTLQMTDISGAANAIRFVAHGRRFVFREAPQVVFNKFNDFYSSKERANLFFLTTEQTINTLIPGAANAQPFEFRMTSDAFFEAIKLTYATDPPGVNLDIRMWEYGSGRSFLPTNANTNINNMFGSAQFPSIPAESYLFDRDYRLSGIITNTDAINCDVYLTIVGRKVKYPSEVWR